MWTRDEHGDLVNLAMCFRIRIEPIDANASESHALVAYMQHRGMAHDDMWGTVLSRHNSKKQAETRRDEIQCALGAIKAFLN